mmetsp:Transcript_37950/g.89458  ORF Transcript_37950/g.89458 Transcript_37950/m.89458 type:complete len:268 (-) Transcript_37950:1443-2246(-)
MSLRSLKGSGCRHSTSHAQASTPKKESRHPLLTRRKTWRFPSTMLNSIFPKAPNLDRSCELRCSGLCLEQLCVLHLPRLVRLHVSVLGQPLRDLLVGVSGYLDQRRRAFLVVVRVPEGNALAQLACAPGAPDPVDVALHVTCHVEVDHVRHPLDVQPPRRHVRCNQELGLAGDKVLDSLVAVRLLLVAVDRARAHPLVPQRVGEIVDTALGVGKHDHARLFSQLQQQLPQLRVLLVVGRLNEALLDRLIGLKLALLVLAHHDLDHVG